MAFDFGTLARAYNRAVTDIRTTYAKRQQDAKDRATHKMAKARTRFEQETIKANLERELLVLKKQMYEAKTAVEKEKKAVEAARRAAGPSALSRIERLRGQLGQAGQGFRQGFSQFAEGMKEKPQPKRRRSPPRRTR